MRFRLRLTAVAATAVACAILGLTGVSPASATIAGWPLANYLPKAGTTSTAMCLTAGSTSGNAATIKPCGNSPSQAWHWKQPFYAGTYLQMANGYGLCLSVAGGSNAQGAHVTAATCRTGHLDQYWEPLLNYPCSHNSMGSFYPWDNEGSGLVLNVHNGSMTSANYLTIWPYAFKCNNQHWGGAED
jgi:hypothetical protein